MNMIALMGNIARDMELRETPNGRAVLSFPLAVNKKIGEADFFDLVAWDKTAELISKYFKKGDKIAVSGRLSSRTWEDKQGNRRKSVEVIVDRVYFTGAKRVEDHTFTEIEEPGELPF